MKLQRGRARTGAEMVTAAVGADWGMDGFNGAAPERARKFQ